MTIYLRFPDEATAILALAEYRTADGEWITDSHTHCLVPQGSLTRSGTYDADGNELTPPEQLAGWHAMFVGELPAAAQPYVIPRPNSPLGVIA